MQKCPADLKSKNIFFLYLRDPGTAVGTLYGSIHFYLHSIKYIYRSKNFRFSIRETWNESPGLLYQSGIMELYSNRIDVFHSAGIFFQTVPELQNDRISGQKFIYLVISCVGNDLAFR